MPSVLHLALILAQTLYSGVLAQSGYDSQYDKAQPYGSSPYGYNDKSADRYGYGNDRYGYDSKDKYGGKGDEIYKKEEKKQKGGRYYYGGKYNGKCHLDGLYYRDDYSFVICSNAKGYVQPCAPGSQNAAFGDYAPGYYYGKSDFCTLNLVDLGYAAPKYGPGYGDRSAYGYADSGYGKPESGSGQGYRNDYRGAAAYPNSVYDKDYRRSYGDSRPHYGREEPKVYN